MRMHGVWDGANISSCTIRSTWRCTSLTQGALIDMRVLQMGSKRVHDDWGGDAHMTSRTTSVRMALNQLCLPSHTCRWCRYAG